MVSIILHLFGAGMLSTSFSVSFCFQVMSGAGVDTTGRSLYETDDVPAKRGCRILNNKKNVLSQYTPALVVSQGNTTAFNHVTGNVNNM